MQAYCLYRLNKLPEALAALKGVERNAYVSQLEALILYRKGELGECIMSYEKLFKQHEVNTSVKANIVAAYVSGGRANEVPKVMELLKVAPKDGFELAHNAACALIERKEYSKAEELLLLARRYVYLFINVCMYWLLSLSEMTVRRPELLFIDVT